MNATLLCANFVKNLESWKLSVLDRHAVILASFVWIYALSLSLPPLFGWGSYGPEAGNVSCSVSWEVHDPVTNSDTYIGFLFVLGLIVPVFTIVSSYAAIVLTLKKVRKRAGDFSSPSPSSINFFHHDRVPTNLEKSKFNQVLFLISIPVRNSNSREMQRLLFISELLRTILYLFPLRNDEKMKAT